MINFIISAIKIIFLLGFLIGIHETGHFLVAKLCKVKVNEFAIGFGPTIWEKQGKQTKYALRLIPLGGFVSMEGESEYSDQEGSFTKASILKRIAIVAAGALVNIVFAIIVYFLLFTSVISNTSNVVSGLEENFAAQEAGIEVGDTILKINNKKIVTSYDINEVLLENGAAEVTVLLKRNNEEKEITLVLTEEDGLYYLGVKLELPEDTLPNRLYYAAYNTKEFVESIAENVKQIFTGNVSTDQLVGPVGISDAVAKTSGLRDFIYLLAVVSISLGVTNLIPFPPLDGGKILFLVIEGVRRKPLKEETEVKIQLLGFAVLITLSVFVAYNDVMRII